MATATIRRTIAGAQFRPLPKGAHEATRVTARVGAAEGLYWFGDAERPIEPGEFGRPERDAWHWRLLLPVPAAATEAEIEAAFAEAAQEGTRCPAAPAGRAVGRGPRRPDAPRRAVRDRAGDDRGVARGDRGRRASGPRLPPRYLHRRPQPDRARAAEDDHPATRGAPRPGRLTPGPEDRGVSE